MVWGLLAGSLAKTAVRTVAREVAGGPRKDGGVAPAATSPRPVSFVVPIWLAIWGGFFGLGAVLAVAGQAMRVAQGHTTAAEAATASVVGALICGGPSLFLGAYALWVARKKMQLRRVAQLAALPGGVPLAQIASELGVSIEGARALALEVLRDEHVIGRIDESGRLVSS